MREEFDLDAVRRRGVLVEREDDDVAGGEEVEDPVERSALADHAEAGLVEPARDERIEPARLERAADEVELAAKRRIFREPGDRRHFPVAEMAGEDQHALALLQGGGEGLVVLDAHQRRLALGRHEAEVEEFAEKLQQVAVVRLRERDDLVLRNVSP